MPSSVMRVTEQEYQALLSRQTGNCLVAKPPKYRNTRCEYRGRKFDSKRERDYFIRLENEKVTGKIRGFACQVSLPITNGRRRMRIDFLVVDLDGRVRWLDSKGYADAKWLLKRDLIEHQLGIKIECV